MNIKYERLYQARCELDEAEKAYLKSRRWKWTCVTPDSCWRWEKRFKGKLICVSKQTALSIEESKEVCDCG